MTLLLACLLFIGVHVPAAHASPLPPTYDGSMCATPTSFCGTVEIRYPFYDAGATKATTDNTTTYSCGYTDLKIFCDATTGIFSFQLNQYNYSVNDIDYDTRTIILADDDAFGIGTARCRDTLHNVTFAADWLRYKDSSHANLTFFLGCYSQSGESVPPELAQNKIDCLGSRESPGGGSGAAFVFSSEQRDVTRERALAEHCSQVVVVPVLRDYVDVESNLSMLPTERYSVGGGLLSHGFALEWNRITTDPCHLCEDSGGYCSYSQNKRFLGCLCADEKVAATRCSNSTSSTPSLRSSHQKRTKIYIIASISCLLVLCLTIIAVYLASKHGCSLLPESKDTSSIEVFLQKTGNIHPKRYAYTEVKRITKSFAVKLGQGGFGAVYKGNLPDGRKVAVKMLKDTKGDGEEFMNEVSSISRTSHVNVVSLLGFCLEGPKRALLYEYMPNGSLERYAFNNNLSNENTLTWEKLFEIAIGIARGLEYLHRGCNTRIVHFDIKPHNILLDQDFCPKISDFGLAKLCLNKESAISIAGARGTIGYIAPEVYSKQFGIVSSKSDVYSYGMLVLEMVGARNKKTNINSESSSQYFPQWIYEHLDDYCINASEINGETTNLVRKMIVVGLWCIQVTPTHRPTMTRVVEMLEGSTGTLDLPPKMLLMS